MTDIYISYEWRIVLCAIFMLHIRLLYRTTAEKVKGVHRMRVEQQSQNIIDVVKQSIGPEEKRGAVLSQYTTGAAGAAVEKSSVSDNAKSVNLKDATYAKPAAEDKQTVAEEIEASATLDAEERKNQMAVLSNTTSPEDYAKMQEDGFSLDDTTTNTRRIRLRHSLQKREWISLSLEMIWITSRWRRLPEAKRLQDSWRRQ